MWVDLAATLEISVTLETEGGEITYSPYGIGTVTAGTVITFLPTATDAGVPIENAEFGYELYDIKLDPVNINGNVWDTTGHGMMEPGNYHDIKIYLKDKPEVYTNLTIVVK